MASLSPKKALSLTEKLATLDKIAGTLNEKAGKTIMGRIGKNPEIHGIFDVHVGFRIPDKGPVTALLLPGDERPQRLPVRQRNALPASFQLKSRPQGRIRLLLEIRKRQI